MQAHVTHPKRPESLESIARALVPELQRRSSEIEQGDRLPDDLANLMLREGFYNIMVPRAVGGVELDLPTYLRVLEILGEGDASTAWNVMALANNGILGGYVPSETGQAIWGSGGVMAGVFAPVGKAVRVDGGYRVRGKWGFGSGSHNSNWLSAGAFITNGNGEIEKTEAGSPVSRIMLVPRSEVTLHDDWQVSGLCGTGSVEYSIEDAYVPEAYTASLADQPIDRPLFRFPVLCALASGIAAVALGNARAALDEFRSIAGGKTPAGTRKPLAAREVTQLKVAEAETMWRSARAWLYEVFVKSWALAEAGKPVPVELRRDMRLATTHATHGSAEAVDIVYHLGGTTGIYKRSPLQRQFRDAHVITQHMLVGTPISALAGRYYLGEDDPNTVL